jgi:hypothetical protein
MRPCTSVELANETAAVLSTSANSAPESLAVSFATAFRADAAFADPPIIGADVISALIVMVSEAAAVEGRYTFTGTYAATPTRADGIDPITTDVDATPAALTGVAVDKTPSPNADTATSAMRLIVVFVDIDFLSVVELRPFPNSAWGIDSFS